eukprot:Opistho-2@47450
MGAKLSTGGSDDNLPSATPSYRTHSSFSSSGASSSASRGGPSTAQHRHVAGGPRGGSSTVAYRSRATTAPTSILGAAMAASGSSDYRSDALFFGYPMGQDRSMTMHSKPSNGVACPVCNATFRELAKLERHLAECLPRACVGYNEDVLVSSMSGDVECSICLEPFEKGNTIARLPCLCMYHKICIDKWFLKCRTCPEHPG